VWILTNLDLAVGIAMCVTLGFGLGVKYWELRSQKEQLDAGSSNHDIDLLVPSGTGSLPGDMGLGAAGDSNPSASDEDHLDHRGPGGDPLDSPAPARARN
jgi:hypothetical protein